MTKFTKVGLSAVAAFALMFTSLVSVVAQDKINASDDHAERVEVKESVEANTVIRDSKISLQPSDTYFEFTGNPGQENDATRWTPSPDGDDCDEGDEKSCKVLIKGAFLLPTSPLSINAAMLPSGKMPVTPTSGANHVPDPAYAGSGSSQPYVSVETIRNKP